MGGFYMQYLESKSSIDLYKEREKAWRHWELVATEPKLTGVSS